MGTIRRTIIDDNGVIVDTKDFKYSVFDEEKGYLFKYNAYYIKGFQGIKLSNVIKSKADYANMHLLAENLYKDTNMIAVYRNKKYYPATPEDMANMLGMSYRRFKEFLERMINLGLIAKVTVNTYDTVQDQYYVNPLYFSTSKYLSYSLYMLFREYLDEYLPLWVIRKFNENNKPKNDYCRK